MTVERELAAHGDGQVHFVASSAFTCDLTEDKKPDHAAEQCGLATGSRSADPFPTDHPTPPSSGSAMATMSPADSNSSEPTTEDGVSWNLVPYDVPWGQDYYQYNQGTLPGPAGTCLFLRSPTPVEKRRTVQACKMCRDRKAKCSGDKPACSRCLARGYICQYLPDMKKIKPAKAGPPRLKGSRSLSHPYNRRDSDTHSIASSADFSEYSSYSSGSSSSSNLSPKQEEQEFPPAVLLQQLQLQYPDAEPKQDSAPIDSGAYLEPYDHASKPTQGFPVHEQPPLSATSLTSSLSFWSGYESPHPTPQTLEPTPISSPAVHAPRPLRYSQSLPFLPSSERRVSCPADLINRSRSAEPVVEAEVAMTVDPRVLTQQPVAPGYHPVQAATMSQEYFGHQQDVHMGQLSYMPRST
ncbi:hypothetical protein BXZ70DRAFT_495926 [Cristinia sonorae]|uniref:Zn(2)-C6 fungal-type domain-containing protein n=1 Tax=Cristinia sonorae TaxID=1940300 RepID=A0A8K0UGK5_9AGAR|nr:hypothetical protein BXZ70DRAFT_495926 [Cristinia sonorae]